MAYTPQQFVGKLGELQGSIAATPLEIVSKGSLAIKRSVLSITPPIMRNVGRRGAKLGVRYTITDNGKSASSVIVGTGPFALLEKGARPHELRPRRRRGRRKSAMNIPGIGPRASAHSPGTRGKHTFERGSRAALPEVDAIAKNETYEAARRVF